jgi:hypothetical protein
MQTMLRADGSELEVGVEGGRVGLTVKATPEACADCLVPKELFASMAVSMLGEGNIPVTAADISVKYPVDQSH